MKIIFSSFLAISVSNAAVLPAHAATIVSPALGSPVTATGSFRANASSFPVTARDCTVAMSGYVSAVDAITFTAGTSDCDTADAGGVAYSLEYPIVFRANSSTEVKAEYLVINTFATCIRSNTLFSWGSSTITRTAVAVGYCSLSNFTLTIAPTVTIV